MTRERDGGPVSVDGATRTALNVVANLVLLLAIALIARVVIEFFGVLAATDLGRLFVGLTEYVTPPLGVTSPRTPYGGVFDSDAAITAVALLLVEWVLTVVRWRG